MEYCNKYTDKEMINLIQNMNAYTESLSKLSAAEARKEAKRALYETGVTTKKGTTRKRFA